MFGLGSARIGVELGHVWVVVVIGMCCNLVDIVGWDWTGRALFRL